MLNKCLLEGYCLPFPASETGKEWVSFNGDGEFAEIIVFLIKQRIRCAGRGGGGEMKCAVELPTVYKKT